MRPQLPANVLEWANEHYPNAELANLNAQLDTGGDSARYAIIKIQEDFTRASEPPRARTAAEFRALHAKVMRGAATESDLVAYRHSDPNIIMRE